MVTYKRKLDIWASQPRDILYNPGTDEEEKTGAASRLPIFNKIHAEGEEKSGFEADETNVSCKTELSTRESSPDRASSKTFKPSKQSDPAPSLIASTLVALNFDNQSKEYKKSDQGQIPE